MKKLFALFIIAFFAFGLMTLGYADEPSGGNYEIMGASGGQGGVSPATIVVPVRYGMRGTSASRIDPSLASGDVVIWDTTSADGFTISSCGATDNDGKYAGVLISTIQTADSSAFSKGTRNWGKMAVKGYCLAKYDDGIATAGQLLSVAGVPSTAAADEIEPGSFVTGADGSMSRDIGVLLTDPGADGLAAIWLN